MTDTSPEMARGDWWQTWRVRDYSWEGLPRHGVPGWYIRPDGKMTRDRMSTRKTRPATLQDIWRSEAGRLIKGPDLRQWTVVHAPPSWEDGSAAKSEWTAEQVARIETAFSNAIARFPPDDLGPVPSTSTRRGPSKSIPRNAGFPLDGAVLIGSTDTTWSKPTRFHKARFGSAVFSGAVFADKADFAGARFDGLVSFVLSQVS
jgi:hypothetical protein